MPTSHQSESSKPGLIEKIVAEGPVLTDGAWGTELMARGLGAGECPDAWNLEFPEHVSRVARDYVDSGSRVILTNTFGANRIALARHNLAGRAREINLAGVELSLRAAEGRSAVFAAMGPSGKLPSLGDVSAVELEEAYGEQAEALASAGADALVVETMSDLEEARIAVGAACATRLPVVACMAFDSGRTKTQTMMGTTAEAAAQALTDAGADVIGANCGQGIQNYLEIYKRLASATNRPIWLKPNAGDPHLAGTQTSYSITAGEFAEAAAQLVEAGATFIGGCCGTTPTFIRELARILNVRSKRIPCV